MSQLYAKFLYPDHGLEADRIRVRELGLEVGKMYKVRDVEMGGWYTDIWLEGYKGSFNSVHFEFYEDGEEIDIYEDPRYNPYM